MSVDSMAQHGPVDEGLACLNVIPVKHPSPGALAMEEACSLDLLGNMLHTHGTSSEYDDKDRVEAVNAAVIEEAAVESDGAGGAGQ